MDTIKAFVGAIFTFLALIFGVLANVGWIAGLAYLIAGAVSMSASAVSFWGVVWLILCSIGVSIIATGGLILLAMMCAGIVAALFGK